MPYLINRQIALVIGLIGGVLIRGFVRNLPSLQRPIWRNSGYSTLASVLFRCRELRSLALKQQRCKPADAAATANSAIGNSGTESEFQWRDLTVAAASAGWDSEM